MKSFLLIAVILLSWVPALAQKQPKDKKVQVVPSTPLPPYFGPRKRAAVAGLEVKVQAVSTTIPTASGTTSVISLDIAQPTEFGTGLTDMLVTALVESKRFIVLERQNLEDLQKEKSLGDVDPNTTPKTGKTLGAQVIIRGAITELSFKRSGAGGNLVSEVVDGTFVRSVATVGIDLKIVDAETGVVLESVRAEGRVGSQLASLNLKQNEFKIGFAAFDNGPLGRAVRFAILDAVKKIVQRTEAIPWTAKVAAVTEDGGRKVYLNAGKDSGLEPGDILEVQALGEEIKDPDTGLVIGRTKAGVVGRIIVLKVEEKLTICEPVEGSGFQPNQIVTFLTRKPD